MVIHPEWLQTSI